MTYTNSGFLSICINKMIYFMYTSLHTKLLLEFGVVERKTVPESRSERLDQPVILQRGQQFEEAMARGRDVFNDVGGSADVA